MLKFPKGFLWGSSTSGPQSEGVSEDNKGDSIWDYWYSIEPENFIMKLVRKPLHFIIIKKILNC